MKQESCEERIGRNLDSTITDLRQIFAAEQWPHMDTAERVEHCDEEGFSIFAARRDEYPANDWHEDSFYEYGLSFDYVASGTFNDQDEPYWRYQLSWGGPSDEIRFYASVDNFETCHATVHRAEYVFMDWFDGAERTLCGTDRDIAEQAWNRFNDCDTVEHTMQEAV